MTCELCGVGMFTTLITVVFHLYNENHALQSHNGGDKLLKI